MTRPQARDVLVNRGREILGPSDARQALLHPRPTGPALDERRRAAPQERTDLVSEIQAAARTVCLRQAALRDAVTDLEELIHAASKDFAR